MLISFLLFACNEKETYPSSTPTDPTTEWDVNPQPESEPSEPAEEPATEPSEEPAEEPSSEPTEAESFCTLYTDTCGEWPINTVCEDWYNGAEAGTEGDSSGASQACYDYHLDVASQQTEQAMIDAHCAHALGTADADGNAPCVDTQEETNGLSLSATTLDLGSTDVGTSVTGSITVTNDAASDITIATIDFSDSAFALSGSSPFEVGSVLSSGTSLDLVVDFNASAAQTYSGTMTITSDSTVTPELTVDLTGEGVEAATSTYTYTADISSILSSCMGCHGNSGGFTLNYSNLFTASSAGGMQYITAGDPSQSYLWHKINGTQGSVGGSGSNMANKSGVNLSATDFSTIETWITEGAAQ